MSERAPQSEDLDSAVMEPPATGEPGVDDALRGLAELASVPLSEHHDHLVRAQERLDQALHGDGSDVG